MKIVAIILAAGKGTRLKSKITKPLHNIGGRPMLAWSLDAAIAANASHIVSVLPRQSEQIQEWLDGSEFCIQDNSLGTGHAVLAAAPNLANFDGVALIMFADTPLVTADTLTRLASSIDVKTSVAVLGFETADPHGYGRLVTDNNGQLKRIVEEKDAANDEKCITFANGGIMAVRCPLLFDLLDQVQPNIKSGEIYLTDIIALANQNGHKLTYQIADEAEISGVNDRADLAHLEALLQRRLRHAAPRRS